MLEEVAALLVRWYQLNKRELPWRKDRNPYYIWVSEIMLQQTRVEAVRPYYDRFLEALPDVKALAECPEDKLLKLWEGLGYYNRVRNMQKAAVVLMEQYGGKMPEDYEALLALPGIGSYTAGAIASIAWDIPVPAVDGNVLRILSRLTADPSDPGKASVKKAAEQKLRTLKAEHPGELNQAWMDLGATVCLPGGTPLCGQCPLAEKCQAHLQGRETEFPVKPQKKKRRIEEHTILLVLDGERVVLKQRDRKGLLAGLYGFPDLDGTLPEEKALEWAETEGLLPVQIKKLPQAKHIFSHVEWHMTGYMIRVASFEGEKTQHNHYLLAEIRTAEQQYAIPSAYSAYAAYLSMHLGPDRPGKENRS